MDKNDSSYNSLISSQTSVPGTIQFDDIEKLDVGIENIVDIFRQNYPKANTSHIYSAYNTARRAHEEQVRNTGEAYISHPLYVAYLTARIKLDESSIIAALLHDTVEDTHLSLDDVRSLYGADTAFLVEGLTTIKKLTQKMDPEKANFEELRKLLIASTQDVRIILIKLADRMHNILTAQGLSEERRKSYALETVKFYAPLADFVGVNFFRKKLEDYAFRILEPSIYHEILTYLLKNNIQEGDVSIPRDAYIHNRVEYFSGLLKKNKIKAMVFGRTKGVYSIHRKIIRKHGYYDPKYIGRVNDLIGITILVDSIVDCYKVLGHMHASHNYIPALFDDYIAKPKDNGYRSLHTCLINEQGIKVALQIKTFKMHEYNEYGPASHIYYKQQEKGGSVNLSPQIKFLKSLVRWKDEVKTIDDYKVDVFKDRVFAFTPKGDVKEFPKGATIVDFAYVIHSNVGNTCKGGKVNGTLKPLDYELQTGDVVEILTDKKRELPNHDWLDFVKTPYAKSRIRHALQGQETPVAVELEEEMEEEAIEHEEISGEMPYIVADEAFRKDLADKLSGSGIVRIKGIDNIDCTIAKCCSPIPGDDIIGHVTKSRGIRVHKADCKDLNALGYKVLLEAEWIGRTQDFVTGIHIQSSSEDNASILQEISKALSDLKIGLEKIDSWNANGFHGRIAVHVQSKAELDTLMKRLKKIQKVSSVERIKI